ncbi:MAG: serine/threonine protein kinase [Alphaproteobacteria bacterium]|nr:serine/threonine protein kinase [Alphaproteobacteria bacterium]
MFRGGEIVASHVVQKRLGTIGAADRYLVRAPDGETRMLGIVAVRNAEMAKRLEEMGVTGVRHRNVVPLLEVLTVGTSPVLLTEAVDPDTTLRMVLDRGPLPADTALALFRGLVDGLAACHAAGLSHRDLRPENVVVADGVARIMDLGVAAAMFDLVSAGRSVTTSGHTIGRPHYWAPERARKPQSADARSDLFSLGCILYELFAGKGPFAGLNLYDCYHATLEEKYVPLASVRPDTPSAVLHLVPMLLRADPAKRPQSCAELLERFELFTLEGAEPATPPSRPVAHPTPVDRTPWIVGGVGVLVVLAGAAWWVLG